MNAFRDLSPNVLAGVVFARTLGLSGVEAVVVSPGSRSSPLTLGVAMEPGLDAEPVLDERTAGFVALGRARASGRPVVLLCTSGSAAAHYLPAVIEARLSGVPLVVVSADRPPEMRDCGSGQTIEQRGLFSRFVVAEEELALPEATPDYASYLRERLAGAVFRSLRARAPVHLNAPFRDPLSPPPQEGGWEALRERVLAALGNRFWGGWEPTASDGCGVGVKEDWSGRLPAEGRGLIVAGSDHWTDPGAYRRALLVLARQRGLPVIADILNPVRFAGPAEAGVIWAYAEALREGAPELPRPDWILQVGQLPTHKGLRAWLGRADGPCYRLDSMERELNPLHGHSVRMVGRVEDLPSDHGEADQGRDGAWLNAWIRLQAEAGSGLKTRLQAVDWLYEGAIPHWIGEVVRKPVTLVVANSMPVRDAEAVLPGLPAGSRVFCNRGANGIDGTLGTALGTAWAGKGPTLLLTGDLALLHDGGAWLAARSLGRSLTILLVDNGGGRIFEHLPIRSHQPPFERFFATPQEVDFEKLAGACGIRYQLVTTPERLKEALARLSNDGPRLLHVRTELERDLQYRRHSS